MGNYLGDFSSCTICVHVVKIPLRIYLILRIFIRSALFTYVLVHRAKRATSYLPHYTDFENIGFYIRLFIKIVNIGAVGGDGRYGSIGCRFAQMQVIYRISGNNQRYYR